MEMSKQRQNGIHYILRWCCILRFYFSSITTKTWEEKKNGKCACSGWATIYFVVVSVISWTSNLFLLTIKSVIHAILYRFLFHPYSLPTECQGPWFRRKRNPFILFINFLSDVDAIMMLKTCCKNSKTDRLTFYWIFFSIFGKHFNQLRHPGLEPIKLMLYVLDSSIFLVEKKFIYSCLHFKYSRTVSADVLSKDAVRPVKALNLRWF